MKKYEDPNFEFRVRDIAAADRVSSRLPRIRQACSSMPCAKAAGRRSAHLADGDMLLTIDGDTVADVEAVQRKMARDCRGEATNGGLPGPARHPHVFRRARDRLDK